MSEGPISQPYRPHPALRALWTPFFDRIGLDENWVETVRSYAAQGTVVYILRNLNLIDFLALDHLTKRYRLPQVRFVNDLGLGVLNPRMGGGLLNSLFGRPKMTEAEALKDAVSSADGSAALFLKRPPSALQVATGGASGGRGLREGEDLMEALISLQRQSERPILLVPQVFVWTKRPDTRGTSVLDWVLGPREWPSPTRVVAQFLSNTKSVEMRSGEPVNLKQFLRDHDTSSDQQVLNRVVYTLLRRMERERRAITGPAAKPPDRVRADVLRSKRFRDTLNKLHPNPEQRAAALKQADEMLEHMQATPSGAALRALEVLLDKVFQRIYVGLDVDDEGIARMRKLAKEGSLVLLPSHKSYIDFLVISYVFYKANIPVPLIVAGENLSFFPMGPVARRAGAFFIRRTFRGDRLYAAVVDAYVRRLFRDGYSFEVFLEGQRSRTGKLLTPKFGLLSMLVSAALTRDASKVNFVPISIGYERIVETGSHQHEILGGEKIQEDAAGLLSATEVLRHRYGRISVQFGDTLNLAQAAAELGIPLDGSELNPKQSRSLVTHLGNTAIDEIGRCMAVSPGALTALALLSHQRRGIEHPALLLLCERIYDTLHHRVHVRHTPSLATAGGTLRRESIREALQMFADAGMVEVHSSSPHASGKSARAGHDAIYSVVGERRIELDTSKNIIIHFFVERALLSTALQRFPNSVGMEELSNHVLFLSRLFKYEFRFRSNKAFDEVMDEILTDMVEASELSISETPGADASSVLKHVGYGSGRLGWNGRKWVLTYAAMIRNFVEGYRIVVRSLVQLLDQAVAEKDLVKSALELGQRMYHAGELERMESISKPMFENALLALQDQGCVRATQGKLTLTPQYATEGTLLELEAKVASYLQQELDH